MRGDLTYTVSGEGSGLKVSVDNALLLLGALPRHGVDAGADEARELVEASLDCRDELRTWDVAAAAAPALRRSVDALDAAGRASENLRDHL